MTTEDKIPLEVGTIITSYDGHALEVTNIFNDADGNPYSIVCKDLEAEEGQPAWLTILVEDMDYKGERTYH